MHSHRNLIILLESRSLWRMPPRGSKKYMIFLVMRAVSIWKSQSILSTILMTIISQPKMKMFRKILKQRKSRRKSLSGKRKIWLFFSLAVAAKRSSGRPLRRC
jgi:hypothetical protein